MPEPFYKAGSYVQKMPTIGVGAGMTVIHFKDGSSMNVTPEQEAMIRQQLGIDDGNKTVIT